MLNKIPRGANPYLMFIDEINQSREIFCFALVQGTDIKNGEVKFLNRYQNYFADNDYINIIRQDIDIFLHEDGAPIKSRKLPGYKPEYIISTGKETFNYCPLNKGLVKKLSAYLRGRYDGADIRPIIDDFNDGADGIIYR